MRIKIKNKTKANVLHMNNKVRDTQYVQHALY